MTKADTARLVAIVVTAYPNFDKFRDDQAVAATVNLWASIFANDDSGIVALALNKHIATSKWPPSVAEIRELMLEMQRPDLITPDKAWLAVSDLLHTEGEFNYGDLWEQLPPLIARAVESIGWRNLWRMYCEKAGTDRLAFIQQYGPMYEREKQRAMTPAQFASKIDSAAAAQPDRGQSLLAEREKARREHDADMRMLAGITQRRALGASEPNLPARLGTGGANE